MRPRHFWGVLKAWFLLLRFQRQYPSLKSHFQFWLFAWSNLMLKYEGVSTKDFKIESLEWKDNLAHISDFANKANVEERDKTVDGVKIGLQLNTTQSAIKNLELAFKRGEYSYEKFVRKIEELKKFS